MTDMKKNEIILASCKARFKDGRHSVMREFLEELEKTIEKGNCERGIYEIRCSFSSAIFLSNIKEKYEEELKR